MMEQCLAESGFQNTPTIGTSAHWRYSIYALRTYQASTRWYSSHLTSNRSLIRPTKELAFPRPCDLGAIRLRRLISAMAESHYRNFDSVLRSIASEFSKLAMACKVDFEAPGVFERIIRADTSVCGTNNPEAFRKMRKHLLALMPLERDAIEELGADAVKEMLRQVSEELRVLWEGGKST